ncbi:aldehyde dehydrogenase family protein [Candidatus Neomarinimicrobiota bacterium]
MKKLYLAGEWTEGVEARTITSPYDQQPIGEVHRAGADQYTVAVERAVEAARELRQWPLYRIAGVLGEVRDYLADNAERAATILADEAGKPFIMGRIEVARSLHIVEDGIAECQRMGGESLPLDRKPWGENAVGIIQRFPRGVIGAISPFNFPLHLVAHKIIPAIASRNALVLKPASQTPSSALLWAEAFATTDLPKGALSILPGSPKAATVMLTDERVNGISFTGSAEVGWTLRPQAPKKHISLELGGNAGAIVHGDTDTEQAAKLLAMGSFAYAGQSCISTQRIFIQAKVYDQFVDQLRTATEALGVGDPKADDVVVGPLISLEDAQRVQAWVNEAVAAGAQVIAGHKLEGSVYHPTIIAGTAPEMKVRCDEVFGPVVTVSPYDNFDEALDLVNDSRYGLQAGVFTNDVNLIHQAYNQLEVGGVIVNNTPTWRIDHMPYGGVKDSGDGREGVRFAMEAMTEPKLLALHFPA